jgi:nucleotide-binding universal stress UspA family protein
MKTLLYCTDGSKYSQVCAEYTAWWASRSKASVHALYVTDLRFLEIPLISDLSGSIGVQPYQAVMGQLQNLEATKSEIVLKWAEDYFVNHQPPIPVRTSHRSGLLVDCLKEEEEDADMVILGKRGENANFATEHLGSTLERVVRSSNRPCLVTSRKYRETRKAVLAYDGGKTAKRALQFWVENAFLHDVELHVVVVAENQQEGVSLKYIREAEAVLSDAKLKATMQMLHGRPDSAIAEYVDDQEMDLLLMGAFGQSRIRELFIGSTTTEMIRACRIPVLLFR